MSSSSVTPISVVYIITRADTIGGAQRHVIEMASELVRLGHKATIICGEGVALPKVLKSQRIPYVQIPRFRRQLSGINDILALREIKNSINKIAPDLVSLHSSKAGILGRVACRSLGVPCVFTAHGWAFADGVGRAKAFLYASIEKRLQYWSACTICVSKSDRDLAESFGFERNHMVVIHNGRHDTPPKDRNRSCAQEDNVKIVMIGRLDRQKDHCTLIHALSTLDRYELTLVGDGPLQNELVRQIRAVGMTARVRFCGFVEDVRPMLDESDIFALISNWEGFPRSTLEAMRANLPVVVSDVGGSAEAVINGETGFVVQRGNIASVRAKLAMLIDDDSLRSRLGTAGREKFLNSFTFEAMRDATITIYEKAIGRALTVE